ncbi:hypothetical protein LSH36_77g01041 [Paralvinella palmiformis]|uniref:Uncharacterized protein n=1 Tax=Paralvinella palmiformis TaxID=53620 RepID=A0AAD9NCV8_9ANNE|nr:hypothetical protein LSH36_77g01041 [Paralvinella palmiformis]
MVPREHSSILLSGTDAARHNGALIVTLLSTPNRVIISLRCHMMTYTSRKLC